ncbi:hypothetical protein L3Q82_015993, partial [Scortum barcoo]
MKEKTKQTGTKTHVHRPAQKFREKTLQGIQESRQQKIAPNKSSALEPPSHSAGAVLAAVGERRGDSGESQPAVARVTFTVKHLDVTQNGNSSAAEPPIRLEHGEKIEA